MGIQGFWPFFVKNYYDVFTSLSDLEAFRGQTWVIDTSIYMYKFATRQSFVQEFLQQAYDLRACGITPIYIFDGCKHPVKQHEHARRREQTRRSLENAANRAELLQKLTTTPNLSVVQARELMAAYATDEVVKAMSNTAVADITGCEDVEIELNVQSLIASIQERHDKQETRTLRVPDEHYHILMQTFDTHNIPFVIAQGDAEKLGAQMCRDGRAHALVTDDGDALVFGASVVIRNLFRPGKSGMEAVYLDKLLCKLQLTQEQMVDMAVMCGCDYTESRGIPGLGPAKALKVLQKHGTLETYLASSDWWSKLATLDNFSLDTFQYKTARAVFLDKNNQVFYESRAINAASQSIQAIIQLMQSSYDTDINVADNTTAAEVIDHTASTNNVHVDDSVHKLIDVSVDVHVDDAVHETVDVSVDDAVDVVGLDPVDNSLLNHNNTVNTVVTSGTDMMVDDALPTF
jgi:5'-3' exonuclease